MKNVYFALMKIGFEYIKYRWKAKRRHGIHSPFVYDLVDKCLRIKVDEADRVILNKITRDYSNSKDTIEIDDHGAGSKRLSNIRKISSIFKTSSSRGKYGKLLYRLNKHYKFEQSLEFGTSLGYGSVVMHLGNPNTRITTIEACKNTRQRAVDMFLKNNITGIESKHKRFKDFLDISSNIIYDFVFIDGHHDGEALMYYLNELERNTNDETIFLLDDIRWSKSMLNAWEEIIASDKYNLTIDFFRVGMISKRPQQNKEHFYLRC